MSLEPIGLPNSFAQPSVAGRKPVSIFIVVDLPQPFEPRKPKISPRRDAEVDVIDGDEIAEPPRQSLAPRSPATSSGGGDARAHDDFLMQRPLVLRHQRDEGFVEIGLARLVEQLLQRARGDDLAVVHRHQPVEALRFVHIGGGDDDAHLRAARADRVDQVPELAARQRVDAGRRLVENQKVGIVDQRAAKAELLLHAAGELAGRARSSNGLSAVAVRSSVMRARRSSAACPNSRPKKSMFSNTLSVG